MSFGTTFTFSIKRAFRKQIMEISQFLFVNLMSWAKYPEKNEVQAQTPPFKSGMLAWTALFSMATIWQ